MAAIVAECTPLPDSTEHIPAPLAPDDVYRALEDINTPLSVGLSNTYRELCHLAIATNPDNHAPSISVVSERAQPQQISLSVRLLALLAITDNFVEVCLHATDDIAAGEALYEQYRTGIATIMTTLGISVAQVHDESEVIQRNLDERPEFMLPQYTSSAE